MARRKRNSKPQTLQTLNPKGLRMGFADNLDSSTLDKPKHPLEGFKFARDAVKPRLRGGN